MIYATSAFVCGVVLLQFQPRLPGLAVLPLMLPMAVLAWRYRSCLLIQLPATLVCGFLWAAVVAHTVMQSSLPAALEGVDLLATGVIESLPDVAADRTRFQFHIEQLSDTQQHYPPPGRVRLSCYQRAPELSVGERWQLTVRMKRPHGMANPGSLDYERTLFQQGIRAVGYIRESPDNRRLGTRYAGYLFQHLRQQVAKRIDSALQPEQPTGLIRALVIGDRSRITAAEWTAFRETGTHHLVAISGLHIGIISAISFFLGAWCWRRSATLCSLMPAPQAGAVAALAGGFCYAGLAGFAIPCVRALVMLSAMLGGLLCRRVLQPARSLYTALLVIVLVDPLSVLSVGFWLSFGAVAVILLGVVGRLRLRHVRFPELFRIQWVVALGLAPILLLLGLDLPLISPLVNMIVVPLFSLLLVPLTLISVLLLMLWPTLGALLLSATAWLLGWSQWMLSWAAGFGTTISLTGSPPIWVLLGVLLSFLLLLLPAGIPGKWLAMLLMAPLLCYRPSKPPAGEVWMTLLDVGQGLAVVLETTDHLLLYDTGPGFPSGFDTGTAVVLPFLKTRGVEKIDRIIISNGDRDHRGGLRPVLEAFPSAMLLSGEPERITIGSPVRCGAGMHWEWDGVRFEILHPDDSPRWQGNNTSCVLAVNTGAGQLLLTGDVEAAAEKHLVATYGKALAANVVTLPHHGSSSSSGSAFVAATGAQYGLVSAGYRNRYRFPKADVLKRWQPGGTVILNTATNGAISLRLKADGQVEGPYSYRETHGRYWMSPPL